MSAPSDETSAITRTTEPKPGWWGSLVAQLAAQLMGRSVERTSEQDTTTSEETSTAETELVEVAEPEIDRHAAPARDPDLIAAGRAWIGECVWSDLEPDYVAELTDSEVISGIARHYDGGVRAFEESGYTVVDAPLPFDVDENGFPTDHRTFQSHTLPDDTHSWLCGKAGCYNSAPDYTTPDESLAAAQEHEISHGYDRELEVAAPVAVMELDEPEVSEALSSADTAVTIEDLEVVEPEREIKAHIVSVDGLTACTNEPAPDHAVEIVNPTADEKCPDCVKWEKDCDHQLVMDLQDAQIAEGLESAAPDDEVTIEDMDKPKEVANEVTIEDVEPAAVEERDEVHTAAPEDRVCELPGSELEVVIPEPVLTDTQQKAVEWVEALESGDVLQAHGEWNGRTVFGQETKCTVQAGADKLGVDVPEMWEIFGDDLIHDCLHRNDGERQSFEKIAKEIRKDQGLEMDR